MNLENLLFFIMTMLPFSFCILPSFHFYTHQKRVYSVRRFTVSRVRLICKSSFLERYSITENAKNAGFSYGSHGKPCIFNLIFARMILPRLAGDDLSRPMQQQRLLHIQHNKGVPNSISRLESGRQFACLPDPISLTSSNTDAA